MAITGREMNVIKTPFFKLFLTLTLLMSAQHSVSMTKTALIIGNSDYQQFSPLKNPANDAKAMASTLRGMGFEVVELVDLNLEGMHKAIQDFGKTLKKKRGLGLFFYAGHGVQVNGSNYLIPVASGISEVDEVSYRSVNAEMVLKKMESAGNDFNIVIMDACRNNPFPGKSRSLQKGLAVMDAPSGSIIAYATAPGATAADGVGDNGLYTSHLLAAMKNPGLSVEEVFKQVRIGVLEESGGKQTPWESSSLTGHFEFVNKQPKQQQTTAAVPPPPMTGQSHAGHLLVMSNIVGATVYVNGVKQGVIPKSRALYLQNLTDKQIQLRVELDGFDSQTQDVQLKSGEWQQAYFEFVPDNKFEPEVSSVATSAISDKKINTIHNAKLDEVKQLKEKEQQNGHNSTRVSDYFQTRSTSEIQSIDFSPQGRYSMSGGDKNTQFIPSTDIVDHQ